MSDEVKSIREQMQSDFKSLMLAFGVQRDWVGSSVRQVNEALRQVSESLGQVNEALANQQELLEGYMERTDARLARIIDIIDRQEEWRATVDQRLDALERKQAG